MFYLFRRLLHKREMEKTAPRKRTAAQRDERRVEIIEAAAEAFMRLGFAATSIDDIARLLGCTKGLIYYHFKNKTDLFFAIHRDGMEYNLAKARPIAGRAEPASVRIEEMVRTHIGCIIDRLSYQRVTLMGLEMQVIGSTTPGERAKLDELVKMYDEYEALYAGVIAEGMADGSFASGEPRMVVKPFLGAMNWMIMWYRPRPNTTRAARAMLVDGMVSFLMRGLKGA